MELINEEKVYSGHLSVIKLTWMTDNGETYTREVMSRESVVNSPDSVAALAFKIEDGEVFFYFVQQNRSALFDKDNKELIEVVAGALEKGESHHECIRREVEEEIGFDVSNVEFVDSYYTSPGCSNEKIFLYVVELGDKISSGGGLKEHHEDITTLRVNIKELPNVDIRDMKTQLLINHFKLSMLDLTV